MQPLNNKKETMVGFRVTRLYQSRLRSIAKSRKMSTSDMLREACELYLKNNIAA
jgi:hypothetical protein